MFDVRERDDTHLDDGADPIERIETAVADLAGEDREHWTRHAFSERVVELVRVRERLDAECGVSPAGENGRGKPTGPCRLPPGWSIAPGLLRSGPGGW
jgi:hypothetical protein